MSDLEQRITALEQAYKQLSEQVLADETDLAIAGGKIDSLERRVAALEAELQEVREINATALAEYEAACKGVKT